MGNAPAPCPREVETTRHLVLRWTAAALSVAAIHGGVALAVVYWPEPNVPAGEPPAAIMIEFAPTPAAPDTPPQDLAVGPELRLQKTSDSSEERDKPDEYEEKQEPEREIVETEPPPEPDIEPPEEVVESEIEEVPELPVIETAEAVLEVPVRQPPREEVEKIEEVAPPPPPKPKPAEAKASASAAATSAPTTTAPKPMNAPRAKTNVAPSSGFSSSRALATWQGRVVAHLNRRKRMPPGGGRGKPVVAFVIDRSGRVISARLIRSSGRSALDRAALALARRGSPVPAPPADVKRGHGRITLTVPVNFSR